MRAGDVALLEARGVTKSYGAVRALRGVDFAVNRGEVVGLVGDNGAGKSTLLKVLCGAHAPDDGTLVVDGQPSRFSSPAEASAAGIAVVYQDLALVDTRDVATNVFLGREPGRFLVSRRTMRREAGRVLADLNVNIPVRAAVSNLSGGQRQSVAIARAVQQGGRLVIMDEPTAALGATGQHQVLELIGDLSRRGTAVILVSHNLDHVFSVVDRVVVLRGGRVAGIRAVADTSRSEIVHLMTADAPAEEASDV